MKHFKKLTLALISFTLIAFLFLAVGCEKQTPVSPLQSGAKIQTTEFSKRPGAGSSFFSGDSSLYQTNSRYGIGDGF